MTDTVLDRLVASVHRAMAHNGNVFVAPAALIWTDEGAQWQPILERLSQHLPIVTLGNFDASKRRGPAYWLRCVVSRTIDVGLAEGTPVVYVPGVGRASLRAVDSCPAELAPIAELQYRSQWFSHPNHRDWSVRALLTHQEFGLGLNIADNADTNAALLLALDRLMDERVDRLTKQVLDADFLHDLVNPDPVSNLLAWLDDPTDTRDRMTGAPWTAFVQQCKADFGFDPTLDGAVVAAKRLAARKDAWANVWKRFADTPERYTGIVDQLRKARPEELIVDNLDVWPQDSEMAEDQLRNRLGDFAVLTPEGARNTAASLDIEHAWRRTTVWAKLDLAPLAFALEQLAILAELSGRPMDDVDIASLESAYSDWGWRADDAAVRALAAAKAPADREVISAACAAMYRPWLDTSARAMQLAIGPMANANTYEAGPPASTSNGTVTVFVDGLRLDVARRVEERLDGGGFTVAATTSLSALPTVTQTSKAALTPVAAGALGPGPDLHPANAVTGTKASIQVLRSLMLDNGVQVLGSTETGDPSGTAWAEAGELDHRGHDVGLRLVDHLPEEVSRIVDRVRELLESGWTQVDVVTDHGWLLVPGGMEKVDLPVAATVIKKGRCARLKDGAVVDAPTVPWFWDDGVRIALAPGISCFEANTEYEHGGVSPQECIVPRLTVTAGAARIATGAPEITSVKWLGLLCRVEVDRVDAAFIADIRARPADPNTSIVEAAKETSGAGRLTLVVPDEELDGEHAHLVLVGLDGQILAQREVIVGRNR